MSHNNKERLEDRLTRYIEAGFPIIFLNTYEEEKADRVIFQAAKTAGRERHISEWNGISPVSFETKVPMDAFGNTIDAVLKMFLAEDVPGRILVLKEPQAAMERPEVVALLRDIAMKIVTDRLAECTVIMVSSVYSLPKELEHYVTVLEPKPLTYEEITEIVRRIAADWEAELDEGSIEDMSIAFKGLSESEIQNILRLAYYQFGGVLDQKSLSMIFEQKRGPSCLHGDLDPLIFISIATLCSALSSSCS